MNSDRRWSPGKVRHTLRGYLPPDYFEPMEVVFELGTPMFMGDRWYHGDSLIAVQLMHEILGDHFHDLPAKQAWPVFDWLSLPLKHTGNVYHSSVGLLDSDLLKTTTIYKRFAEDERVLLTTKRIRKGSGKFRDFMMQMPYSTTKTVTFHMCGNIPEVRRVLSTVRHIGKKASIGGGEVVRLRVSAIEEDRSLISDGKAARELPCEMLRAYDPGTVMLRSYKLPYWDIRNVTECIVPGGRCVI